MISAALASLKTATDIANLLRSTDLSLEKAELKLKLADLLGSLADVKMQVIDLQEVIVVKEHLIADLEEALDFKGRLQRTGDAYYLCDDSGSPTDGPYCMRCWEVDHRACHLTSTPGYMVACQSCDSSYDGRGMRRF